MVSRAKLFRGDKFLTTQIRGKHEHNFVYFTIVRLVTVESVLLVKNKKVSAPIYFIIALLSGQVTFRTALVNSASEIPRS